MAIIMYGIEVSPPVRAAMVVCKALGVEFEFRIVDLLAGDHLKPEFLKVKLKLFYPYSVFENLHFLVAFVYESE